MASKTVSIFVNVKGNAQKALKGIGTQLGKNQKQVKTSAAGWKKLAGAVGGMVVLTKVVAWQKENVRLALIQERAEKRLEAVYGKNIDGLKKYASALQNKSTLGDEEILLAQSKLAVFVKEEEQLKTLTQATLDFAVVNDMDLGAAMALVGKTVGSSTNALARYGIEVEGAKGSTERINSTIKNLNELFGGAAFKDSLSVSGQIKQAENSIGDLREEVGEALLPAMLDVKKATVDFYEFILDNDGLVIGAVSAISNIVKDTILGWSFLLGGKDNAKFLGFASDTTRFLKEQTRIQQRITHMKKENLVFSSSDVKKEEEKLKALRDARATYKQLVEDRRKALRGEDDDDDGDKDKKKAAADYKFYKSREHVLNQIRHDATEEAKKGWEARAKAEREITEEWLKENEQMHKDANAAKLSIAIEAQKEEWRLQDEEALRLETRKQTTLDIAQQTVAGVAMIMSAVSNNRQQEHDNEIRRQKEEVENSTMSAKQKAKALKKIDEQASKASLKLRVAEWRQNLLLSVANTALAVTKTIATMGLPAGAPFAIAAGVLGGIQTGIIAGNKPKMNNGGKLHSKTGQLGDVIPFIGREGETVSTPAQDKAKANGGGNSFNYAPQISFPAEATEMTKNTFGKMLNDHARDIEEMFVNQTINSTKINGALAI